MTIRHITLASIGAFLGIIGSIYAGVTTVSKRVDDSQQNAVKRALYHEQHDEEIDQRLQRLEMAVHVISADQSEKQRYLLQQVMTIRARTQATQESIMYQQRSKSSQISADAAYVPRQLAVGYDAMPDANGKCPDGTTSYASVNGPTVCQKTQR